MSEERDEKSTVTPEDNCVKVELLTFTNTALRPLRVTSGRLAEAVQETPELFMQWMRKNGLGEAADIFEEDNLHTIEPETFRHYFEYMVLALPESYAERTSSVSEGRAR